MKPKFTYHLHPDVTPELYEKLPEEVRKVYISVIKKIPMDESEKARIIKYYPDWFIKRPVRSFGQAFKRLQNVKAAREKEKGRILKIVGKAKRAGNKLPIKGANTSEIFSGEIAKITNGAFDARELSPDKVESIQFIPDNEFKI